MDTDSNVIDMALLMATSSEELEGRKELSTWVQLENC